MKKLRKYLIEVFGFSQSESKGFIIFFLLVLVFFILSNFLPDLVFQPEISHNTNSIKIQDYIKEVPRQLSQTQRNSLNEKTVSDPNTMSFMDWRNIGLDQILADRIISFRLNGGRFIIKEDLKKIYGLNDSIYNEIDSYLAIAHIEPSKKRYSAFNNNFNKNRFKKKSEIPNIHEQLPDLNKCDSSDLLFIKGIGPKRASRIIKYRNRLGGFKNITQLKEVYGIDSIVFNNLISNTTLNEDSAIYKINLNTVSFEELLKHPYMDYNTCKVIINYRKQHGKFERLEELKQIKIIDSDFITRMGPYLQFL
ncbi:helix-hairpin-helix domain-containing protein [Hyphobacterium sp. CCMP332]|nr:helix-hairpin-helix domain-containing protein [Hyphobacterium sp. CCMP332]